MLSVRLSLLTMKKRRAAWLAFVQIYHNIRRYPCKETLCAKMVLIENKLFYASYTIRVLKSYQIWDGFFVLAKLNEGRRSNATLTGVKQRQSGKDDQRCYDFRRRTVLNFLFPPIIKCRYKSNNFQLFGHV